VRPRHCVPETLAGAVVTHMGLGSRKPAMVISLLIYLGQILLSKVGIAKLSAHCAVG
jgi:hypothetical protein